MNPMKEIRLRLGLSQKYVALSLSVKPPSVSDWESGKSNPTIENLLALADLYHVSVDELLGREVLPADSLTPSERELLAVFRQLNGSGRDFLLEQAAGILKQPAFRQDTSLSSAI